MTLDDKCLLSISLEMTYYISYPSRARGDDRRNGGIVIGCHQPNHSRFAVYLNLIRELEIL